MKPVLPRLMPLLILGVIAACGPADNDPGPGGVTVGEARALDEAAEMLEARRLPPEAIVTDPGEDAPTNAPPENDAPPEE